MNQTTKKRLKRMILFLSVAIICLICYWTFFFKEKPDDKNIVTKNPIQKNETWQHEKWDGTYVSYEYNGKELSLPRLAGWEYEIVEYVDEQTSYGINFHPTGKTGWIEFHYYPSFAVCGTELKEKDYGNGRMGTYDNNQVWSFITSPADEGSFVALTNDVENWWSEYGEEAMDILDHALLNDNATDKKSSIAATDFSVRLFQHSFESEQNTLISPISVLYALSMTANGAEGNTLTQMEQVLGMPISEQNAYMKAYRISLSENKKTQLHMANSIWFAKEADLNVKQDFLRTNKNYYGAEIFEVPFDHGTQKRINKWVKKNTDGMIKNIIDQISPDAVMYLINALAFEGEWENIYQDTQIQTGTFTTECGQKQEADMMHSEESAYLQDENATGFLKYYANNNYAFVALLPKEDIRIEDYLKTLTGEKLYSMLKEPEKTTVYAAIPKFKVQYSVEMNNILKEMGMTDAFVSGTADFSNLCDSPSGNIFINQILHKAAITVDERGTEASAATSVGLKVTSAMQKAKEVTLNRPFVYLLIDCKEKLPVFMGSVMSLED